MVRSTILLILVSVLYSCEKGTAEEAYQITSSGNSPEVAAIRNMLEEYYADMTSRDWEKYRRYFWANATITTAWQQPQDSIVTVDVTSIDDFIKEAPTGPDSKPIFEERMKNSEIHIKGNLAEAWVSYDARFGSSDSILEWSGTDVFSLLKHNGEWRIVSLVFESDQ